MSWGVEGCGLAAAAGAGWEDPELPDASAGWLVFTWVSASCVDNICTIEGKFTDWNTGGGSGVIGFNSRGDFLGVRASRGSGVFLISWLVLSAVGLSSLVSVVSDSLPSS